MNIFETSVLQRVVDNLDQPSSFLLDTFFPLEERSQTEIIYFDVRSDKPRITPFVAPEVEGKVVVDLGYTTQSFRPAYVKDKRRWDPSRALRRRVGERIGGDLSPGERRELALAQTLTDQVDMLTRRETVMAASALVTGSITVSGERYPTRVINFGRSNDHTVTLTGGNRWGETGIDPLSDIETWASRIQTNGGVVPDTVIMDPLAWGVFRTWLKSQTWVLDYRRGFGQTGEPTIDIAPQAVGRPGASRARYKGSLGEFEFWVYADNYVDESGNAQKMLPDHTVILGARVGAEGVRHYGLIMDEDAGEGAAGYAARRYFVKSWVTPDPSARWVLLQSAPLPVLYRPNATLAATVR